MKFNAVPIQTSAISDFLSNMTKTMDRHGTENFEIALEFDRKYQKSIDAYSVWFRRILIVTCGWWTLVIAIFGINSLFLIGIVLLGFAVLFLWIFFHEWRLGNMKREFFARLHPLTVQFSNRNVYLSRSIYARKNKIPHNFRNALEEENMRMGRYEKWKSLNMGGNMESYEKRHYWPFIFILIFLSLYLVWITFASKCNSQKALERMGSLDSQSSKPWICRKFDFE